MFALTPEEQRWNLEEFRRKSNILLTNQERDYLHDILKQYKTYRDVQRLMVCLCSALDTPRKLDLLREIRNLIPLSHIPVFDRLAPYSKMMHPYYPVGIIAVDSRPPAGRRKIDEESRNIHNRHQGHARSSEEPGKTRMVSISRDRGGDLGFGIKGCPGKMPGVIVSHVAPRSQAESNGLKAGVQIIEVNNIDFETITVASALLVLQGSDRLRMKIMYARPINGHQRDSIQVPVVKDTTTTWIDTVNRKKVSADYKDDLSRMDGTRPLTSGDERRVILQLSDAHRFIGFNIRGGCEYGLGIYVSRVDKGGLAEAKGIHVGDQIVNVNGENFEQITHTQAVEIIKNLRHLIMTIRSVNRYPAYKQMSGEEGMKEQMELKPKEKPSRPSSVHLPVKEVKLSKPFQTESKPKQPTAEIKPLSYNIVQSKPLVVPPSLKSKPPVTTELPNGTIPKIIEKSEQLSIETEPKETKHVVAEDSVDYGMPLSPIPEVSPPVSPRQEVSAPGSTRQGASVPGSTRHGASVPGSTRHGVSVPGSTRQEVSVPGSTIQQVSAPGPTIQQVSAPGSTRQGVSVPGSTRQGVSAPGSTRQGVSVPGSTKQGVSASGSTRQGVSAPGSTRQGVSVPGSTRQGVSVPGSTRQEVSAPGFTRQEVSTPGSKRPEVSSEVCSRPSSQATIATQMLKVPSPPLVPTADGRTSPVTDQRPDKPPSPILPKAIMGTTALTSPNRTKLGRSMSMKMPGEKPMPSFDDEKPKKMKVQRNRTFREILFGIKVKHKDKESAIGKDKTKKSRKRDKESGLSKKHSVLSGLRKSRSKELDDDDDQMSKAGSSHSGDSSLRGSISEASSIASAQGSVGKHHGTQILHSNTAVAGVSGMVLLAERAKLLLNNDEIKAIRRHVKRYHKGGDIENLVEPLLAILDKPEKMMLLNEIRGVISATDVGRFDSMVSRREFEAREQMEAGTQGDKSPRDFLATSPSQRRKIPLNSKSDQQGKFHLQDQEEKEKQQRRISELERLQKERKEEVKQLLNAENNEALKTNEEQYGHIPLSRKISPDKGNTVSGRPKERRNGLDNLALPKSSIVRRHSDNATGQEAMLRNLAKDGAAAHAPAHAKLTSVKPTSPPPPPPPQTPTKPYTPPPPPRSPVRSPPPPPRSSVRSTPPPPRSTVRSPPPSSIYTLPPNIKRTSSPAVPESPTKSPLSPLVISSPISPVSHFNTSTPLPRVQSPLPPPPPDSTFSPTISPEAIDALPPPPPPEPIPPPLDVSPLPPPPHVESLSPPPPPPMATHPSNLSSLARDSPPPPPPISPPPPPQLSPETFLMAQKANNNFDTTRDENTSDSHIYSEINFNNMDITDNNNTHLKKSSTVHETSSRKSLTFNVPSVKESIPNICISGDEGDDSGDDVALPNFSDDSETSVSDDNDGDDKKTYTYNFIEEEEEESTDTSFELTSPSQETPERSFSAPPALTTPTKGNDTATNNEPIYAEVDKSKETRSMERRDTLTVEFDQKIMVKEEKEEEAKPRRSSRVSFGEYRGSPLPPRRGILKNSFNRQEGGPKVPIRSVPDYISISSDEDEPSPLKEITDHAKRRAQEDLLRPADDITPSNSPKIGRKAITVELSKFRSSLGISIAGGRESQGHPMVRIDKVFPGGAAADNGSLKPGYEVLEVDGTPLTAATHPEAVDIIRRSYNDKSKPKIEFVVIPYE